MMSCRGASWRRSAPPTELGTIRDATKEHGLISTQCIDDTVQPARLTAVLEALTGVGTTTRQAPDGSAWIASERWGLSRFPLLPGPAPGPAVVEALFRSARAAVLDFLLPADHAYEPTASLYLYEGPAYSLDQLTKNGRRDARKALRELRIGWITHEQLLLHGLPAYADCRVRVGLSDGTSDDFQRRFERLRDIPGHHYLGAWKGDELAAFMTVHAVETSASIAAYSNSAHRGSCPNDGLIHVALHHCINERGLASVSYGLSSVQEQSNAASLHEFKLKAGFRAVPVRRVFRVHPWAAPLVNRGTLATLHALLRVTPRNRFLKKASGVLAQIVSGSSARAG